MNDFMEKWRSDSKYRAKMQLLLYGIFFIGVAIYAATINTHDTITNNIDIDSNSATNTNTTNQKVINIPDKYNYITNIVIDDANYQYSGTKESNKITIAKIKDNITTNYVYENNEYYILDNGNYVKTTKDEVYDIVNYNYINLDTINEYLNKATKNENEYWVYLKDIILGNDSEEYFIITVNDNNIDIDYTPLMKQFNNNVINYKVTIKIDEIE